jgi:hypothetical protein
MIALILIAGLIAGFIRRRQTDRDLLKGDVAMINGQIHIDHDQRLVSTGIGRMNRWSLNKLAINGVSFKPSGKVWQAFSNNRYETYRVYYAPHTLTILSTEFIEPD